MRRAFVACALAFVLSVSAADAWSGELNMAPSLTESDNGKTISLKVGAEATLRLPENPSTGYRWALDAGDSSVAAVKEQSYAADGSAPGAGGAAQWAIQAAAPGSTTIKLKRWRSWEGDASVVERYEVTVRVSP